MIKMGRINSSVGRKGVNAQQDVNIVRRHLNRHRLDWYELPQLLADAPADKTLFKAIEIFQRTACGYHETKVDALVAPKGFTFKRLAMHRIPRPRHLIFRSGPMCRVVDVSVLKKYYKSAAEKLGVEADAIQAIVMIELAGHTPYSQFYGGRPTLLFERHLFARETNNAYQTTHPDICNPGPGGYGKYSEQYTKLRRAATLNETAALRSASWGVFQILGSNYAAAGYTTVDAFVSAMNRDLKSQFHAFISFIGSNKKLLQALKDKDWDQVARYYNGPAYKNSGYHEKLKKNYEKLSSVTP